MDASGRAFRGGRKDSCQTSTLKADGLASSPSSAAYQLCELGQITRCFCSACSSHIKRTQESCLCQGVKGVK